MKNLFYRLIIFLDTAQENDTNYNIAWFMANNFYRIADMRISELASECFVSPATISRFCRALGYENFAHLKQECYTFHSDDKKFNNLINKMCIRDRPQTTLMILCNPHNPIGKIWSQETLQRIGDLAAQYHVVVVSDEIQDVYKRQI